MIPYILYVAIVVSGCLIFYKLLLQKETFFKVNRVFLIACLLLAFTLPLVRVPSQLSFRKTEAPSLILPNLLPEKSGLTTKQEAGRPVVNSSLDAKSSIRTDDMMQWAVWLYWFGVIVFAINFLVQLISLLWQAYSRPVIRDGRYRIVEVSGDKAPCSFGNSIFINPEKYDWDTYSQILLHEKIHVQQGHTFDLVLAELVLIFQWFNPFAWAYRRTIESNIEFLTDRQLLNKPEIDTERYQMSLLKVSAPHFPLSLTTNYNQSLLKKRIFMMNSKRSNIHTGWKYFFIIPMMVLFVTLFNEPIVKAQTSNVKIEKPVNKGLSATGSWFATIKDDKVQIQFTSEGDEHSSNSNTFKVSELGTLPREGQGTFSLTRDAGVMEFTGRFEGNQGMGQYKFTANKEFVQFVRSSGVKGEINEQDHLAFFFVNVSRSYVKMLNQNSYDQIGKSDLIAMAALEINEEYIRSIKNVGFKNISAQSLIPFRALKVDASYINEIRNAGYPDLSPDRVISLKAQGIDAKYLKDIKSSVNLAEKSPEEEKTDATRAEKLEQKQMQRSKKMEEKVSSKAEDELQHITAFKALDIDADYINSIKSAGLPDITDRYLISMKANGVTKEYIQSIRSAGFPDITANDIVAGKAMGITASMVSEYKALGFESLEFSNIISAKATGTTPAFIKSMKEKGHNLKSIQKYITLKTIVGES